MYTIELEYKRHILSGEGTEQSPYVYGDTYNIALDEVNTYLKENAGEHYCGLSANSKVQLHFTAEPAQEIKDLLVNYWNSIDEESPEAEAYCSEQDKRNAMETLKQGLVAKTWDQMSVAERKLVIGQVPTKEELGL